MEGGRTKEEKGNKGEGGEGRKHLRVGERCRRRETGTLGLQREAKVLLIGQVREIRVVNGKLKVGRISRKEVSQIVGKP